jgi:CHAT domain-containing protein
VLDRVVSSYTPTVRALGFARERDTSPADAARALVVAMPTTPHLDSPLGNAAAEAEVVRGWFPDSTLLVEGPAATGDQPTAAAVLAHLERCAVAHFACHSTSHQDDPSQSRLLLHDHHSNPLTVAALAPLRYERARLAYLSACRTAFSSPANLANEALHLTTAFQLIGYPHVVGTLWEIHDRIALKVARDFYAALTADGTTIDTRRSALALHRTVSLLRNRSPNAPSGWAAYVHAGA